MGLGRRLAIGVAALGVAGLAGWFLIGPDWRALIAHQPYGRDILFWNLDQRDAGFRMLDQIPFVIESHEIAAGDTAHPLPDGEPLVLDMDMDAYLASNRTAGLVILQDGKVRLERYALGFDDDGRWTSFSVAKSLTSTLVGAAIRDGAIKSLNDPVSDYIDELSGSAYADVTVEQLLTMTSGIAWNEDYDDPNSDVAQFDKHPAETGKSATATYMATLPRAHPPGEVWNYSTGETNLIGILVIRATGKPLAEYLSEKVWQPYGMQQDASWLLGNDGYEISGCCIQAAVRDFARFGQFILDGGAVNGQPVLPEGWLEKATQKQVSYGAAGEGYGYQWWTWDDGSFQADGIFGQGIFIDPARRLVIASNSSWTSALGDKDGEFEARKAFYKAVQKALDADTE
ncbi:serine hydrolase domain-containing protein [Hyphomonas oceanitis]|uniref:Beta-lactamase n=1 Tax=Hyphomonas oceanitis SCH89 TaxID=1280953 RepID=A0A059G5U1_9PROT|nr:serine hydrolase [Hyphomonas oceanitis]KDA02191.1 beta-lactamase [Hyphomonas oceanitis SCH89]